MRKRFLCITLVLMSIFTIAPTQKSHAIIWEIVRAAATKIIKAVDLAVQRLQTATIKLQNAQRAIENELSKLKLGEIADWGEKQRQLFKTYYDELWKVKSLIEYYKRVKDIIAAQGQILKEYKTAFNAFSKDSHFSAVEITHIYNVYMGMLSASVKNIDQLTLVVNSLTTQMSDAKRLEIIHSVSDAVNKNLSDLRAFTNQNIMISMQRAKTESELTTVKNLYGLP